jgi:uncharacterized protein YutE (UPF0331/DUF86 family)
LVDAEQVRERLLRLERLVERLETVRGRGERAYLADEGIRLQTERALQVAEQIAIDLAAQLVTELPVDPPSEYAGLFLALADAGTLPGVLAARLADAARQRNLLVHIYMDIDDRKVFASLERVDDLRAFAAAVAAIADADDGR